jgi:hypothetical protein
MSPLRIDKFAFAVNKNEKKKKVHFVLEGDGFDPEHCKLEVRPGGQSGSWDCDVVSKNPQAKKLIGWFKFGGMAAPDVACDNEVRN